MLLLDEHVDIISDKLKEGGITDPLLHADLLDHVCSYIEENDQGEKFDVALQEALHLLAPNGVHEIEEERFFLFHFHKQITMKKILFFSGFASAFLITTGFTFKYMHWPGANMILLYGYVLLLVPIFMVLAKALRSIGSHSTSYLLRIFAGIVAALLISIGSIFKLHHWPSANIQFMLGMLVLNFVFLPMFFYHLYKQSVGKML
jgi:hypothetical protein